MAATSDGESMAFIGHMQNFIVDGVDVIALLQRHSSTATPFPPPADDGHSVLADSGDLTYRELPIPVHPVTLTAGSTVAEMGYIGLTTLDLSYGNATLKMMFKTMVSSTRLLGDFIFRLN